MTAMTTANGGGGIPERPMPKMETIQAPTTCHALLPYGISIPSHMEMASTCLFKCKPTNPSSLTKDRFGQFLTEFQSKEGLRGSAAISCHALLVK